MPDTKQDPVYLHTSSCKKKTFANGGSILNVGVKADDLRAFIDAHTNARGFLNLVIKERREEGKYGDTHYVVLDTWEPKPKDQQDEPSVADIPF
jgi:hypothetical protein|tara:strand:+ start:357 stop:638 length:282 start_codon:yes stop_codon:yes gene_type:complete